METEIINPFGYFYYLKLCKYGNSVQIIPQMILSEFGTIKPKQYYDILSAKVYICELIFNGINMFPEISEYTITFKNENGICHIVLGLFEEYADKGSGNPCMAKCVSSEFEDIYCLELSDIQNLYCYNRYREADDSIIDTIMVLVCMGGSIPTISTSFKNNKEFFKKVIKFK